MNKYLAVMLLTSGILLNTSSFSHASDGPFEKLKRGLVNVVSASVEVPKEIRAHWIAGSEKTFHISAWLVAGFIKGSVLTVARTATGVYDIVTFPLPVPADYEPVLRPAYVFDEWPQRKEGVVYKNIGDK